MFKDKYFVIAVSYTHLDVYKRQVVRDYLVDYKLLIVIIKAVY